MNDSDRNRRRDKPPMDRLFNAIAMLALLTLDLPDREDCKRTLSLREPQP